MIKEYVITPKTTVMIDGRKLLNVHIRAKSKENALKTFKKYYHTQGEVYYIV